jgi:hypothetical protein
MRGVVHQHIAYNRCHATFADFKTAIPTVPREDVPRKLNAYREKLTDNFHVVSPQDFRTLV